MFRHSRARAAWALWTALVFAGGALATSLHPTRSAGGGARLIAEVCTTAGVVTLRSSGAPENGKSGHHEDTCPWCRTGSSGTFLINAHAGAAMLLGPTAAAPTLFFESPRTLFPWAARHARGPPAKLS